MGIWYLIILAIGIFLLVKSISAHKNNNKSKIIFFISITLVLFSLFMFSPLSNKLIDLIF
ncbi:MAG: hypothetical protein TIS_03554 [Tissierella sp.]